MSNTTTAFAVTISSKGNPVLVCTQEGTQTIGVDDILTAILTSEEVAPHDGLIMFKLNAIPLITKFYNRDYIEASFDSYLNACEAWDRTYATAMAECTKRSEERNS